MHTDSTRRKLLALDVTDAEKRRLPSKHYSYVIKVSWSDRSETVIYRRYSKFFDFQIILLETFPREGGLKEPSDRIIPFLPGKILFRRSHVRDVAMKRLKPIDEYCKALVKLPAHISESDHVLDFFETKPADLNPVREETSKRKRDQASLPRPIRTVRRTRSLDIGEISGPLLLEQYLAIAEYSSTQNKELSMTTGQLLEVIEKNENGWWFVSNDEGERGWVPGVYLEKPDGSVEDLVTNRAEPGQGEHYVTIHAHTAENPDDITFGVGVIVEVLQKNLEGWWLIKYNGKQGFAPASYLEKAHDWVQENNRPPVQIISSIHDLKHRHSLPAARLSSISLPSQQILNSSSSNLSTISAEVHTEPPSRVMSPAATREKAIQPPPKRSSVKRAPKKRPDGPPPLPPTAAPEPTYEYMTVAPFNADIPDGVSFDEEKKVDVLEKSPGGWWYIQIGSNEGWAPASYIEKREKPVKPSVPPPSRPGLPKLLKTNSTGCIGLNGNTSLGISHPVSNQLTSISNTRSQSVISPAKRPLPPLPVTFGDSLSTTQSELKTYEEVGANVITSIIEEELPTRTPPLPPTQEQKPSPKRNLKNVKRTFDNPEPKVKDTPPVDFRSALKSSIAAKQIEVKKRYSSSSSSSGSEAENVKPKPNAWNNRPKPALVPSRPKNVHHPVGRAKSNEDKPSTEVNKKPMRPPKSLAVSRISQEVVPKLPPKPKTAANRPKPALQGVHSADEGAVVDFRSVLRSTKRNQPTASNGVGRSKSFNADKLITNKNKLQVSKPPSVPKKPSNLPLKPPVPSKIKGIEAIPDGAENVPKSNVARRPNGKPSWTGGKAPVLRRYQINNSNSNVESSEKPVFTVGHAQIEIANPPDISMKRGSPDGQVDDKYREEEEKPEVQVIFPPERFKKKEKRYSSSDVDSVSSKSDSSTSKSGELLVAVSDYAGVEECEISFPEGAEAEVVEKSGNWWYVSIDGRLGWAPCSFFRRKDADNEPAHQADVKIEDQEITGDRKPVVESVYSEIDGVERRNECPALYKAAADFITDELSTLSLRAGDQVTVTQVAEGGWWFAILNNGGGEGWVPSTYLDPM